jgi:predicted amidohydrolase YtcJ
VSSSLSGVLAAAFALSACTAAGPDAVLLNGKVFTANPAQPWGEAIAIRGERVIAVGETATIAAQAGPATRRLDLGGRTVVPGFNDAHLHVAPRPPRFLVKLSDNPSARELEKGLVEADRLAPSGQRLQATIADQILDDSSIDRAWLDVRVANRPVMLVAFTGHGMILNSPALRLANVEDSIADPEGGRFGRDASGRLNGRVEEYAEQLVWRRLAALVPPAEAAEAYRQQALEAVRLGITSIQLMGTGQPQSETVGQLLAVDSPVRWRVLRFPMREAGQELTDGKGMMPPQPSPRIDARGMKWILDGTPVERLAALRAPYADRPTAGRMNLSSERLRQVVGWAYGSEDPLAMHAVGDAAIEAYFTSLAAAGRPETWRLKRPRLEHGDLLFPDLIVKAKALGVVVVQNPAHFTLGSLLLTRLGPERLQQSQPLKTLLAEGIPLAFGSDGALSPFLNIMLATTHPARPSEALTREEAITAYTRGSAFAEFMEKERGHLGPGALADLAVLSADVFTVPTDQLPSIHSVLTMIGGRIVHDSGAVRH